MNILVTGVNGQLGNEMRIASKNTVYDYIFTGMGEVEGLDTTYLDTADIDAIRKMANRKSLLKAVSKLSFVQLGCIQSSERTSARPCVSSHLGTNVPSDILLSL